jgi:hypothetical protein
MTEMIRNVELPLMIGIYLADPNSLICVSTRGLLYVLFVDEYHCYKTITHLQLVAFKIQTRAFPMFFFLSPFFFPAANLAQEWYSSFSPLLFLGTFVFVDD